MPYVHAMHSFAECDYDGDCDNDDSDDSITMMPNVPSGDDAWSSASMLAVESPPAMRMYCAGVLWCSFLNFRRQGWRRGPPSLRNPGGADITRGFSKFA